MKMQPVHSAHDAGVIKLTAPEVNPRHDAIRKDIAGRLRKSCSNLSEAAFAELVEKMVQAQLKGERRFGFHHSTGNNGSVFLS